MRGFVFLERGVVREFGRRTHVKESSRNNKASLRYLGLQLNADFTAAYGQNLFSPRGTAGSSLLITRSLFNRRVARKEMLPRATSESENEAR